MGTSERRQRQKEATREGILNAAREIARTDGWEAVTVRRVAERIDYTPPVIYEYFENKNAILIELQQQGFALLAEAMRAAGGTATKDATDGLLEILDTYWRFAHEQPEIYGLMHGSESAALPLPTTFEGARLTAGALGEVLIRWAEQESLPQREGTGTGAVEIAWALVHGMVTIEMMGRVGDEARARALCRQAFRDLLAAWKGRGSLP